MSVKVLSSKILSSALVISLFCPATSFAAPLDAETLRGGQAGQQPTAQAGLEQAMRRAAGLEEEFGLIGANAVAQKDLIFSQTVQLPNGSYIVVDQGGEVVVAKDAQIGPFSMLAVGGGERLDLGAAVVRPNTVIEGQVTIGKGVQVWGTVQGHPKAPTILGPKTSILSQSAIILPGVFAIPVADETGKLRGVQIEAAKVGEGVGKGPVVLWGGTAVKTGAVVRSNTVLQDMDLGPASEAKATVMLGAPWKNSSELAHRAYGGNLIAIPVYVDGTPMEDVWHQQLLERLSALRFGRVTNTAADAAWVADVEAFNAAMTAEGLAAAKVKAGTRDPVLVSVEYGGRVLQVRVRGHNMGNLAGHSNWKSPDGGRKNIAVLSAGVAMGIAAQVQGPVFVGPDSIVDSMGRVTKLQAGAAATYARPLAATSVDRAFREGAVVDFQGKGLDESSMRLFLANLKVLHTLAQVALQGLQNTQDPIVQAGLCAEVDAYRGQFDEIDAGTTKELALFAKTDQPTAIALARQAKELRDSWGSVMAEAGLEEPVVAEGSAPRILDVATFQAQHPGIQVPAETDRVVVVPMTEIFGSNTAQPRLYQWVTDADPGLSGSVVIRSLEQAPSPPSQPIIVVSNASEIPADRTAEEVINLSASGMPTSLADLLGRQIETLFGAPVVVVSAAGLEEGKRAFFVNTNV